MGGGGDASFSASCLFGFFIDRLIVTLDMSVVMEDRGTQTSPALLASS